MLECAFRGEFEIVYVKDIQIWARSVEDGVSALKKLKIAGVKVIFEDGYINNFDHEMIINILLSTAQKESRAKSVAIQFGIRSAQEQGKYTSQLHMFKEVQEEVEKRKELCASKNRQSNVFIFSNILYCQDGYQDFGLHFLRKTSDD